MAPELAASSRPHRPGQARIRDTLHDDNGTRLAVVSAFTTVNPDTEDTVRAVDYQIVSAPDRVGVWSNDKDDLARPRRVRPSESS